MRRFALHFGLFLTCAVILLPILWVVRTSFLPESLSYSPELMPAAAAPWMLTAEAPL